MKKKLITFLLQFIILFSLSSSTLKKSSTSGFINSLKTIDYFICDIDRDYAKFTTIIPKDKITEIVINPYGKNYISYVSSDNFGLYCTAPITSSKINIKTIYFSEYYCDKNICRLIF